MRAGTVLAAVALLVLFSRSARARVNPDLQITYPVDWSEWWGPNDSEIVTGNETTNARSSVDAFLWMIGAAETSLRAMEDGTAFRTFYGGSLFSDLSDHPVLTGERVGVPLPESFCRAAGRRAGCVSTAAGAFQILAPTWESVRRACSWGPRLPDFSHASQIEAARRLLEQSGALAALAMDDFSGAVALASRLWASLPGSTAKQGGRSLEWVASTYSDALGVA